MDEEVKSIGRWLEFKRRRKKTENGKLPLRGGGESPAAPHSMKVLTLDVALFSRAGIRDVIIALFLVTSL